MERSLLFWLPLVATVVLLLAGCAAQSSRQEPRQPAEEQTRGTKGSGSGDEGQSSRGELGAPALGDADAPVVMVEYGDFQ